MHKNKNHEVVVTHSVVNLATSISRSRSQMYIAPYSVMIARHKTIKTEKK